MIVISNIRLRVWTKPEHVENKLYIVQSAQRHLWNQQFSYELSAVSSSTSLIRHSKSSSTGLPIHLASHRSYHLLKIRWVRNIPLMMLSKVLIIYHAATRKICCGVIKTVDTLIETFTNGLHGFITIITSSTLHNSIQTLASIS